jgi:twitching motility protein PilT
MGGKMAQVQQELEDVLVEQGLLKPEQVKLARDEEARTGESMWKILLQQKALTEKDLVRGRAAQFGLRFVDVASQPVAPDALALIPEELARRQVLIPIGLEGDSLLVAMAEPTNHLAIEELSVTSGRQIVPAAAYRFDLGPAIDRAYHGSAASQVPTASPADLGAPGAPAGPPSPMTNGNGAPPVPGMALDAQSGSLGPDDMAFTEAPATADVGEVSVEAEEEKEPNLAEFLFAVIESDASDLHLTAGLPPTIRVHGELKPLAGYRRLYPKDLQQLIYAILTQKQREEFDENHELDISYSLPGAARFRVNVFQQRESIGSVMRMIPFGIKDLDTLGIPAAVKEFANLRRGMVLVTGITGSGKSTTLAGLVDMINETRPEHIMTVEDPIEFLHKHKTAVVNQREVGTDTHGFAEALKRVLRQDPDVILVGELRDLETIQTALTAAETGHLVFATLHTQDAPQSVDRLIDVFPPHQQEQIRIQLAGTLAGIVSQQLVPTADGKGRVVACEVLVATSAVRNLIREGKTHQIYTSMQSGGKHGMQVMDQSLAELVKKGKVTYEMALERSHHVEEFNRLAGKG